jgi:serine/threonine protein kinase
VTRPIEQDDVADENAIKSWLNALVSGSCNEAVFLQSVRERFGSETEGRWAVLSQLDQYYRRGKLKIEVFRAVKKALAQSALDAGDTLDIPVANDVVNTLSAAHAEPEPALRREDGQPRDAVIDLRPGSVLRRRYRIETILGQGTMGVVFQALDEYRLETPPAGQRLAIRVAHTAVTKRAELLTELRRAFQQMQRLSHPNIVRVFEFDVDGPIVFFTMELLNGAPLSRVLQTRKLARLSRAQAWAIVRDIGAALSHAHARAVVHGDVNPQNVFITISGELRVLDFAAPRRSNLHGAADHEMMLPSAASSYASCQVLEGKRADARDDIFSLACIAFELLMGEHPFAGKTAIEARKAISSPRRPPNLTHQQWQALRAGLGWEREKRPSDMQQWLQRLNLDGAAKQVAPVAELLESPPHKERKSRFSLTAATAIALLLAAGYWVISHHGVLPRVDGSLTASAPSTTPNPTRRVTHSTASTPTSTPTPEASANSSPSLSERNLHPTSPPGAREVPASHDALPVPVPSAAAPVTTPTTPTSSSGLGRSATPAPATTPPRSAGASPSARPAPAAPAPAPATSSGPSKIELAADTIDVPVAESSAQVTVRRKGSLRGEANFTWWTESGTAKPGVDFSAIVPQVAHIGDGKPSMSLSIPVSNAPRAQAKSFYVVIEQTAGGTPLGARTLTMVTLPAE